MTSGDIVKVGVGLLADIPVVWNDLRSELKSLVDCGMMARLLLAEKYWDGGFQNLSMEKCAVDILGCRVDKTLQVSDWSGPLTDAQICCESSFSPSSFLLTLADAGMDAVVALRLYEKLVDLLDSKAARLGCEIAVGWYGFDSRMGEPTRLKRTVRGEEVAWSTKDCPWFFGGKFQGYYP